MVEPSGQQDGGAVCVTPAERPPSGTQQEIGAGVAERGEARHTPIAAVGHHDVAWGRAEPG